MGPPTRVGKTRWILATITLLFVVAWSLTLFVSVRWTNGPKLGGVGIVQFSRGGLDVWTYHLNAQSYADSARRISGDTTGWGIVYDGFGWPIWRIERGEAASSLSVAVEWLNIPLWPLIAVSAALTSLPWMLSAWALAKA